jgi:prepilin-type N-terminal cleavage/methylation domain-containing protein
MGACSTKRRTAFTLVEVLVVVSIIALLMALVLPGFRRAREQARIVKCVSNLRSIGQASLMYMQTNREWFPFEKRNWPASSSSVALNGPVLSGYYYGGHPGRPGSVGFDTPALRVTFREKPLNRFLYENLHDLPETEKDARFGEFDARRSAMPVFQCPSDVGPMHGTYVMDEPENVPNHYLNGSSYVINYHYVWLWAAGARLGLRYQPYVRPERERQIYLQTSNRFLRHQRESDAWRFVLMAEKPFDSAQWNNCACPGWHKQTNYHTLLFTDGRAAHMFTDVTQGNTGTRWKTASGEWYHDQNDPDYRLRNITR